MKDEVDQMFNNGNPELMFDAYVAGDEISLKIIDFYNYDLATENKYMVFQCEATRGIPKLGLGIGDKFRQHFPIKAFSIAWSRYPKRVEMPKGRHYDVSITFKRESKKKISISYVEVEVIE